MSYTLGQRQNRLYTEFADLYQPNASITSAKTYSLMATDVRCMFVPTENFDKMQGATQFKEVNIQTSDGLMLHSSENIGDDWVVHLKSTSLREPDTWKIVSGAPKVLPFHAKAQQVYLSPIDALTGGQIV